ncbi:hypothetical protein [Flavobacterium sp.]|uniref:hypothetical protein n=1 Tax=Flavobacterium sp. TaxID=239 RepID=UPI0037513310
MENITERLVKYMEVKDLTAYRMTADANLSVGLIGKAIKGKSGLNIETIEKILLTYDDLNAQWFVTGKGEMLIVEEIEVEQSNEIMVDKELLLDMFQKVDYLFKLSIQENATQELNALRDRIMK